MALLDPLYEAAARPEMWRVFLQKASEVLQADKVAILLHASGNARTAVCIDLGISEEVRRDAERMMRFSPWAPEIEKHLAAGWYSGSPEDVLSLDEFRKSKFYNEFFRKHDMEWAATAVVLGEGGSAPSLSLTRPRTEKPFSAEDKLLLKQLLPHLKRVFKIQGTITGLHQQVAAGQHALDLIGAACITLDDTGRILSMNRRAEVFIADGSTLRVRSGMLQAAVTVEQSLLDSCIVPACACGSGTSPDPGAGALVLHSPQGVPLYLSVLPYRSRFPFLDHSPAALVFITTPEEIGSGEHRLWKSIFGLSPAECRIAEMMKKGMEVNEISDALRIKVDTVRYYQKCVYRKTGVRGQGQLMRLLTRLPSTSP